MPERHAIELERLRQERIERCERAQYHEPLLSWTHALLLAASAGVVVATAAILVFT